ncbi:TonB-dependent receptor [Sphingomonas sp. ASV193]|uniref:TonB-dependent receptor domain-containing protein n=1 Tax=Sphingomonas sp. ASV193 TaxID=3144405 RepID=UPI0032E892BD
MRTTAASLLLGTCLLGLASPALAQAAPVVTADPTAAQQANGTAVEQSTDVKAAVQSGKPTKTDDGSIVVTGTRIRRPNIVSAAPITSVTMSDIRQQGAINVEDVMNHLPQVAPDAQQNYQDSDGRQRLKLRNLGFERTLVLVDGQRLGTQNGEDVGIIPTSLIERVDVLSGGASSVYGSDAIAGVVNFILRKDFNGIELNANYNFYNHFNDDTITSALAAAAGFNPPRGWINDGGRADITLTAGKAFLDGRLHLTGFVDYRHNDLVRYTDRSSSACQLNQGYTDGPLSCQASTYSPYGYISPQDGPNAGARYINNPNGDGTFVPYSASTNAANPFSDYPYQRASHRLNAGGFASFRMSDAAELYATGIWFRDKSTNPYPTRVYYFGVFQDNPYQVNCDNPFLSPSQATALCGANAGTSNFASVDLRYRFNAFPPTSDTYINKGLRLTGGIRGDFGGAWHYDVGGVYARNRQDYTPGFFPDVNKINNSLDVVSVNGTPTCQSVIDGTDKACVPFNAFIPNNSDKALYNYLFTGPLGTNRNKGTLKDVTANLTGDLGKYGITSPLAEHGVAVAAGLEYRQDKFSSSADQLYYDQNGGSPISLEQHVKEANAEIQAPLVERQSWTHLLQVNGGYRISKYNTNPKSFSTWKVEALWAPVSDVTFRGSFNKAQRAPTVIEINQATGSSFTVQGGSQNDFCAPVPRQVPDPNHPGQTITTTVPLGSIEVCRATGLPDNLYGSPTLLCPNDQCTVRTGGFIVNPETAYTKTFGVLLQLKAIPRLVFSVDRYLIDLRDSIGYNDYSYYQDGCLQSGGDPYFCSKIIRNPGTGTLYSAPSSNPTTGFIEQGTTNAYTSKAHGYDFQAQYALPVAFGRFDWSFNGSYTTLAGGQDSPLLPTRNCAGYFGNGCGQLIPKWMHNLQTNFTTPNKRLTVGLNWRHIGSLVNANNSGDPAIGGTPDRAQKTFYRIAPQDYFDLSLSYVLMKHATVRLYANNLFDRTPPILPNSYNISLSRNNTIPQRYDSLGRNVGISLTSRF